MDEGLTFGLGEVHRQAALAYVQGLKVLALVRDNRARVAAVFTIERLHLDHVRAEVRQRDPGKRAGDDLRELKDPDASERAIAHVNPLQERMCVIGCGPQGYRWRR